MFWQNPFKMSKAKLINITDPKHHEKMAVIMLKGGVVGSLWGHHLYFLACNAHNKNAVKRLNEIKGRPENQVLASPGGIAEAEEYSDLESNTGLIYAAKYFNKTPKEYLRYLYNQFPLAVELYANQKAPTTVTHQLEKGKTIWIVGHTADPFYMGFLESVRNFRKIGHNITFAGTSMNLSGENTLTVKEYDLLLKQFGNSVDAISVHPETGMLTETKYGTSSSAVSFIHEKPLLLRLGATPIEELKKFIPDLQIPESYQTTIKASKLQYSRIEIPSNRPDIKIPTYNLIGKISNLFKR